MKQNLKLDTVHYNNWNQKK